MMPCSLAWFLLPRKSGIIGSVNFVFLVEASAKVQHLPGYWFLELNLLKKANCRTFCKATKFGFRGEVRVANTRTPIADTSTSFHGAIKCRKRRGKLILLQIN